MNIDRGQSISRVNGPGAGRPVRRAGRSVTDAAVWEPADRLAGDLLLVIDTQSFSPAFDLPALYSKLAHADHSPDLVLELRDAATHRLIRRLTPPEVIQLSETLAAYSRASGQIDKTREAERW